MEKHIRDGYFGQIKEIVKENTPERRVLGEQIIMGKYTIEILIAHGMG